MLIQTNDSFDTALEAFGHVGHEEVGAVAEPQLGVLATLHGASTVARINNK